MLTTLALLLATLASPDAADWAAAFPAEPAGALTSMDFADQPDVPQLDRDAAAAMAVALERDFEASVEVDLLLATRAGQRVVNSAILCRAVADLTAEGRSTSTARRRLAIIGEAATARMERARITPLACNSYPVERLVNCLGLLPSVECTEVDELATQVRAATRLTDTP